jgi:predicted TPR repeat methyltransferase
VSLFSFHLLLHHSPQSNRYKYNLACIYHASGYPNFSLSYLEDVIRHEDSADSMVHSFLWTVVSSTFCSKSLAVATYQRLVSSGDVHSVTRLSILTKEGFSQIRGDNAYISSVFDSLAEEFENRLVNILEYNAPMLLLQMLKKHIMSVKKGEVSCLNSISLRVLDLGCGSGLAVKAFHELSKSENLMNDVVSVFSPLSSDQFENLNDYSETCSSDQSYMIGVDVSSKMIDICQGLQLYNYLECCDLFEILRKICSLSSSPTTSSISSSPAATHPSSPVNCILAADTFIYVGYLGEVFSFVSDILSENSGFFLFSTEELLENEYNKSSDPDRHAVESSSVAISNNHHQINEIFSYEPSSSSSSTSSTTVDDQRTDHQSERVRLLNSGRFAHSLEYIELLANDYHFTILSKERIVLRKEVSLPIMGNLYLLQRKRIEEKV